MDRQAWDGGRLPLNPGRNGWRFVEAFPGLGPTWSIGMAVPPGEDDRLILLGMGGLCFEVTHLGSPSNHVIRPFLDISERTFIAVESGFLGMAFHPRFQTNGQLFVYYSHKTRVAGIEASENRLSRFTVPPGGDGRPDPDSELVLFSQADPGLNHNGGGLHFGPDGYLYLAVGDGSVWDDRVTQRIDRGFFGGILRIDVDRRPGNLPPNPGFGSNPEAYSVPSDNPFVGRTDHSLGERVLWSGLDPATLRTEFHAIGLRNPWQMSFDPVNGDLWVNDVGNGAREEVNRVRRGDNFGWPFREGLLDLVDPPIAGSVDPVFEYSHLSGRIAITGSRFYRGSLYPELDGTYLFCDWTGDVGSLMPQGTNPPSVKWIASVPNTVAFGSHPKDGSLLLTPTADGVVKRMVPDQVSGEPWPQLLSQTGLFEDLVEMKPRPGLVPYEVNVPFWSDYAAKRRWFAVPGLDARIGFRRDGAWTFPAGTVWVKHFDRPYVRPDQELRRLETRVLIRTPNGGVAGASYRWNDEGTEAELVPSDGANALFNLRDAGGLIQQAWRFPSAAECLRCHSMGTTGGPAGFSTAQLNRTVLRGTHLVSQLDSWAAAGYFEPGPTNTGLMPALVSASAETASLEKRVRSYLEANCVQCHQPPTIGRARWDARATTPLELAGLVRVPESVPIGTNVLSLIEPGHPERSALFLRVSELGAHHMPPLATSELDKSAIELLRRWIRDELPSRRGFRTWLPSWFPDAPVDDPRIRDEDPDGDGVVNYAEYLMGSDPLRPEPSWKTRIQTEASGPTFRFPRLAGRRFEVEWTGRLDGSPVWTRYEHPANDPGTAPVDAEAVIPIPTDVDRFYRVRISEE